jgi:hypothetical protein
MEDSELRVGDDHSALKAIWSFKSCSITRLEIPNI